MLNIASNQSSKSKEDKKGFYSNQSNNGLIIPKNIESSNDLEQQHVAEISSYQKVADMQSKEVYNTTANYNVQNPKPSAIIEVNDLTSYKPQQYKMHNIFPVSQNWDEYPDTISKNWIQIEKMKEIGKFNVNFIKNIELIRSKGFAGWKKSRGDGNCYFRAVMVRFLEFLFKVSTPLDYAYKFYEALKKYTDIFLKSSPYEMNQFIRGKENLEQWIQYLLDRKRHDPVEAFCLFIYYTQDKDFDIAFVYSARLLAASFLLSHDERISMFFDEDFNTQVSKILTMGEEAEGLALLALPLSLEIKVVQYNLFDTAVNIMEFPDDTPGNFEVSIIRRGGHYDILYKIQELEDEQYNFATGCYHFPA